MTDKTVTLLSLNSRRDPQRHQYYRGFKNVAYLTGYVNRIEGNQILLQMTNNFNLLLPVSIPPAVKLPRDVGVREALKMKCQVQAHKNEDGTPGLRVVARSFERPNILELPLQSAFQKVVPVRSFEDREFKPYGAGNRPTDACNQVSLAGMVVGINNRPVVIGEDGEYKQSGRVDLLLRQDDDVDNIIPVRYYGKLAERIATMIKLGEFVTTAGRYRVAPIEVDGSAEHNGGKAVIAKFDPYIHIDTPSHPTEHDIIYLGENSNLPKWTIETHERFKLGQQRRAPKPDSAREEGQEAAAGKTDVPEVADFEKDPRFLRLSPGDQAAARESEEVRAAIFGT